MANALCLWIIHSQGCHQSYQEDPQEGGNLEVGLVVLVKLKPT